MSFSRWSIFALCLVSIGLSGCLHKPSSSPVPTTLIEVVNGITLEIQEVPEGVSFTDIVVREMTPEELPLGEDIDRSVWKGYDFGPDGTTFSTGVIVSIPYETGMPAYFHLHDGVATPISSVEYILGDEGNIARFSLDSFSSVLEVTKGVPVYTANLSVSDAEVGEYLGVNGKITMADSGTDDEGRHIVVKENMSKFNGSFWLAGPVTPTIKLDMPTDTKINDTYTLNYNKEFLCNAEGEVSIIYKVLLVYETDFLFEFAKIDRDIGDVPAITQIKVATTANCVKKKPICGDGKVNQATEQCDGSDLQGKTCSSEGFGTGPLTCNDFCVFEYELCKKITERKELSCAQNSWEEISEFDDEVYFCRQDCDKGTYCDTSTCTCKDQKNPEPYVDPDKTIKEEIIGFLDYLKKKDKEEVEESEEEFEDDCDLPGVDCDDEEENSEEVMMMRLTPYTFICPNGEGRSGTYITDQETGEAVINAAGEKLDSITGQPIPPCPSMK